MKQSFRRLLSVILTLTMILTLWTPAARAESHPETTTENSSVQLEMEAMDPSSLRVKKLGETEEDAGQNAEQEPYALTDLVRVSVFLDKPGASDAGYSLDNIGTNSAAITYRESLKAQQTALTARAAQVIGYEPQVKWNLTLLTNAVSCIVRYGDLDKIRALDGVKSVELERQYSAPDPVGDASPNTASTSENMVGATNAWYQLGYTGAGSRVAIIDTGLDTDHQSVNSAAFDHAIQEVRDGGKEVTLFTQAALNAIPASQLNSGSHNYLNTKIPYAYNYVDNGTRVNHQDSQSNHGSHVAGIAAANRYIKNGSSYDDAASTVKAVGMAPDAQILVMKVFGTNGGAYDSDYFAAIEDAVVLGADACNLSLGSGNPGFTYAESSYQAILNGLVGNATNGHMVLSISAGNAGSFDQYTPHKLYAEDAYFHTGGSPGSYLHSMGVAAAQNTLTEGTPLKFNGSQQVFYTEDFEDSDGNTYTNAAMTTVAGTWDYVYIDAKGEASDYSTVNSAVSLTNKIVIVNRGDLSFSEKGNNAKSYNPKALIIANNGEGTIHMNLADFTGTFPMVAILLRDAETIKTNSTKGTTGGIDYYTGRVEVTTTSVSAVAAREDAEITDFSSWGVPGSLIMKPEITAPGGDIYSLNGTSSASSDHNTGTTSYVSYSGTSMAAPHITGLAAVLMQYLKEVTPDNEALLSAYDLRAVANSLLMSTATPMINNNAYLSLLQQGAGLVEVSKAIEAKSVIMMDEAYLTTATNAAADGKVKVELGDDPEKKGAYDYSFTIYNISDKTLTFELDTDLFTQAVTGGDTLSHKTAILPAGGVTYEWNGAAASDESHDVNKDGTTNEADAQAILDCIAGLIDIEDLDEEAGDMDGDGMLSTYDAHLLLNWEPEVAVGDYSVAPGETAQVTVHIRLTAAQKAALEKEGGAYLEGFTYVTCTTSTREGASYAHEHTIPILGYYGSWTDATMFDTNSYTEQLYGNEQLNYSGKTAESTNYMRITTNGTTVKFSGNPYMVEEEFPADRLAIRSDATINDFCYNLIRSAAGTDFAITKLDADGNVDSIVTSTMTAASVTGLWYSESQGAWQGTSSKIYSINKALNQYNGISEGDRVRIGFYAIPEYNAMMHSTDLTDASAGTLTAGKFTSILTSNELGKGAFVGFDFTVDDTAPTIASASLNGSTLSVTASDDRNLAYVAILSLDGSVSYAEAAPGTDSYTVSFNASDAIANANGYVAAFVGDYAGNEAAVAIKVNNNTQVSKTVYVLTNTVTAGDDYLIMSRNSAGTGYGLYYTLNSSQSTATAGAFSAEIKAGNADTGNQPYIESSDAASTGIWTAGNGSTNGTYTFNNNGWYLRRSNTNNLTITKDTSRRDWNWDGTNNRLSINSRYLRYYNNTFSLNTATNSVYLYVKTTISYEVDPYSVSAVTVTPGTLDLYKGNTASLTAKVTPLTASDRTVTWSSTNTGVATVDQNGTVTALAAGTAVIRATSNADSTKYGECTVSVISVNKTLYGIVWDEEGGVYFSNFNANSLPAWNKNHSDAKTLPLTSAFMQSTSNLYAATLDTSAAETKLYTVNRTSYALTEYGTNFVFATDMAIAATTYAQYVGMVYTFGPYLVAGPITPGDDGEGGTYSGLPYGLLDCSEYTGDAYLAGIACKARSAQGGTFYFLDENGVIWSTTLALNSAQNGFDFSAPSKQCETGIGTSFLYQNLYYDGTYLYWGHQDGETAELIIIRESDWQVFHAGDFGTGVWPVTGLYVNGSVAPASVEDEPETAEAPAELEGVKLASTREEMLTKDILARFREEADRMSAGTVAEESDEPVMADQTAGGLNMVRASLSVQNTASDSETDENGIATVTVTEDTAGTNGWITVDYDPDLLTPDPDASGSELTYYAFNFDEKGLITFTYADKNELPADTVLATIVFQTPCEDSELVIQTWEHSDELELNDDEELTVEGRGHDWGEIAYTWEETDTGWQCTAERICARNEEHVETETVTAARSENGDEAIYTATFENEAFEQQIKTVEIAYYLVGSMTDWAVDEAYRFTANAAAEGEYLLTVADLAVGTELKVGRAEGTIILTWYPGGNNYTVDYAHAGNVNVYFRPAGNYWNDFHEGGFFYISRLHTVTIITDGNGTAAIDPEEPDYTASVTLTATPNDGYHFGRTEFYQKTGDGADDMTPVTLDWNAESMTFTMPAYDLVIKVFFTAHSYGEVSYVWTQEGDTWTCTAARECTGCDAVQTETVTATAVTTPPTCEQAGSITYTAEFTNEAFETQTKTVAGEAATGHAWGEASYVWADDNSTVTATRSCANDPSHIDTETATATAVTTPPTCEQAGSITYTAEFTNEAFETQTKTVAGEAATGHAWGEASYVWADDNSTVTATRTCANDPSHIDTETATATAVTTPPTCEQAGSITYTAEFTNEAFETQTKTVTGEAATGHAWGEVSYVWADDNSTVTATRSCANDPSHIDTETATASYAVITPATTEAPGLGRYTAEFENEAFETQTKDVVIPQLPIEGYHIIVTNWTGDKTPATTSLDAEMLYSGEVSFAVTCAKACVVALVTEDEAGNPVYERLTCTTSEAGEHQFTVTVTDADVQLEIAIKGDANLDGSVNAKDTSLVSQVASRKKMIDGIAFLAGDVVDQFGKINAKDTSMVSQIAAKKKQAEW